MEREIKQVIVVRKDLNMRKGKIAAQVAHGSLGAIWGGEDGLKYDDLETSEFRIAKFNVDADLVHWLDGHFTKVVVYVESEEELLALAAKAKKLGLRNSLIRDCGKTEFHNVPTYTVLAVGPNESSQVDQVTGNLKLL